jgi:hypothetical protein
MKIYDTRRPIDEQLDDGIADTLVSPNGLNKVSLDYRWMSLEGGFALVPQAEDRGEHFLAYIGDGLRVGGNVAREGLL